MPSGEVAATGGAGADESVEGLLSWKLSVQHVGDDLLSADTALGRDTVNPGSQFIRQVDRRAHGSSVMTEAS
jgi:hypothetical protein